MKLSSDKQTALLAINGELSVAQIETLIADLAELRAAMSPDVPSSPPKRGGPASEVQNVSVVDDPHFSIRALVGGGIRLWLRSDGLGWIIFDLSNGSSCALRDYLNAHLPESALGTNLFGEEGGQGGSAH